MAGRLAWILAGGAAIVGGMAIQGDLFSSSGPEEERIEREIRAEIDEAKSEARDARTRVVINGRETDQETVRAMTEAVAALVEAETELAATRLGSSNGSPEVVEARARRDRARALVDELKTEIEAREGGEEVRQAVHDQVRSEVREAVRNN